MDEYRMTYRFAVTLAIVGTVTACASTPAPSPSSAGRKATARTELRFEKVERGERTFFVQHTKWADGSEAHALAGLRVQREVPLEIVVLDDLVPTPRSPDQGPAVVNDLPASLDALRLRQTSAWVKGPLTEKGTLPRVCDNDEISAVARLSATGKETPTIPRSEATDDAPLGDSPLGNIVCLRWK